MVFAVVFTVVFTVVVSTGGGDWVWTSNVFEFL